MILHVQYMKLHDIVIPTLLYASLSPLTPPSLPLQNTKALGSSVMSLYFDHPYLPYFLSDFDALGVKTFSSSSPT